MTSKRSYQQNCALAIALDQIGERWTLLIVRELLIGPRRFGQLLANLTGMGTNLLTNRLGQMIENGLVEKVPANGGHAHYRLSPTGQELEASVLALIRWGMQFPEQRHGKTQSRSEWDILPLRACVDPDRAQQWQGSYCLVLDGERHHLAFEQGQLVLLDEDDSTLPVATIEMSMQLALALNRAKSPSQRRKLEQRVVTTGSKAVTRRFLDAFI